MSFLTVSNKNFKNQGTRLSAIVVLNKGLGPEKYLLILGLKSFRS